MKNEIKEFTDNDLKSTFESAEHLKEEGIDKLKIQKNLKEAEEICKIKGFLSESDAEPFYETFLNFEDVIRSEKCDEFHKFSEGVGVKLRIGNRSTVFGKLTGNVFTSRIVNGEFRGGCVCYMRDVKYMENIIENSIIIYNNLQEEMKTRGLLKK